LLAFSYQAADAFDATTKTVSPACAAAVTADKDALETAAEPMSVVWKLAKQMLEASFALSDFLVSYECHRFGCEEEDAGALSLYAKTSDVDPVGFLTDAGTCGRVSTLATETIPALEGEIETNLAQLLREKDPALHGRVKGIKAAVEAA